MVMFESVVDAPVDEVFAWHSRPGAIRRLTPPWLPATVEEEAGNLRDGRAVLRFGPLWRWVAQHQPDAYRPPEQFADELVSAPLGALRWRHTHRFEPVEGGTCVRDQVETGLPERLLREMFAYRQRQLAGDLEAHRWARQLRPEPLTVAMTGSSGFIGRALAALLSTGGHRVVRLVRRPPSGPDERFWDTSDPAASLFQDVDAVVHLAGKNIFGRFSEDHKHSVVQSRVGPTQRLAEAAARAVQRGPGLQTFICASAVGYYGPDGGDAVVDEGAGRGQGFLAELVEKWEGAAHPAADAGLRVANVRTGIVQSPDGGMLKVLYPLFLAGLGGKLGGGRQWVPWVALDDIVGIYLRLLVDQDMSGPVNAVAPGAVTNQEYTSTLARVLRRPAIFNVPALAAQAALTPEGAREFALAGQRAVPGVLQTAGHHFRYPDLEHALRHMLGRRYPLAEQ